MANRLEAFADATFARPIPRYALRRLEAAAAMAMSPSKFDELVADGRMPKPYRVDNMALWDADELRQAWEDLKGGVPAAQDGWSDV